MKIFFSILLFIAPLLSFTQPPGNWSHVYDSVIIVAENTAGGSTAERVIIGRPIKNIAMPLPAGEYNFYLRTNGYNKTASKGLPFSLNTEKVRLSEGESVNLKGGTTENALVLIDTGATKTPPTIYTTNTNEAFTMWKNGAYWYAYVKGYYDWALWDYHFKPNAGEVWDITYIYVSYDDGDLFDNDTIPEPPAASLTYQAEVFAATGGPVDAGNNQGVKAQGEILGYINVGDWVKYSGVDLSGIKVISFRYACQTASAMPDRVLEVRTGSITGPIIGALQASGTSETGWDSFQDREIVINDTNQIVDLFFTIRGTPGTLSYWGNLDYFTLKP